MRSRTSRRAGLARTGLLVMALVAGVIAHGCLLPELVVGTGSGSGGSAQDGTGAMGGDASGGAEGEASGGAPSSGGVVGSGGADGVGGTDDGTGGMEGGSGGNDSGGSGGGSGSGGAGTGGMGSGGVSAGCGTPTSLMSGETSIDVDGTIRDYVLDIPENYAASTAHTLVFAFHHIGSTGPEVAIGSGIGGPYFGLKALADDTAIFVAPTGISETWSNANNRDVFLVEALLAHLQTNLCIDESRIFAVGFSVGASMTVATGCSFADTFRAIAPISALLASGCDESSQEPIAVWTAHGQGDTVVSPQQGEDTWDVFLGRNGCSLDTAPVSPSPCVAYDGCDVGYPVHYCLWDSTGQEAHAVPSFAPAAIWDFFGQF